MLSNRQIHILKYLYPDKRISENELFKQFDVRLEDKPIQALSKDKLIFVDSSKLYQPKLISLTEQGRAYVENLLNSEAENELRISQEKQAIRRSWIQLLVAAFLGGIFAKFFDWIPSIIEWLKALSK